MDEIHSLKLNGRDQEKTVSELKKEVDAQKNTRQAERQTLKKKDSEIETLTKQNTEKDIQLKAAQQKINDTAGSVQIAELKGLLQRTTDQLHAKEKEHSSLELERTADSKKLKELDGKQKEWQAEVTTNKRELENLRTEAQRSTAETKRLRTAVEEAETLETSLRQDIRRLQLECDQSRTSETRVRDAEAAFAVERDDLQRQIMELQLARKKSIEAAGRARKEAADESQKTANASRSQIEDVRHQLKQAEAKNREMEAAHQRQIQYHCQSMEAKYQLLVKEVEQGSRGRQRATQSVVALATPAQTACLQQSPTEEDDELPPNPWISEDSRSESPPSGQKDQDIYSFFDEEFQNGYGTQQILDPAAEVVIETQEVDLPRPLSAQSSEEQGLTSNNRTRHCSSPDLSSADSELMTQLEQASGVHPTTTLRGRDQSNDRQSVYRGSRGETSAPSKDIFDLRSQSPFSQDRPKSQANTASRMMPPQGSNSQHFSPRTHTVDTRLGRKAQLINQRKSNNNSRGDRESSVASEDNVRRLGRQNLSDEDISPQTPRDVKRKDLHDQYGHRVSPKKLCLLSTNSYPTRSNNSISPSNRAGNGLSDLLSLPRSRTTTTTTPRRTSARLTKNKGEWHCLLLNLPY